MLTGRPRTSFCKGPSHLVTVSPRSHSKQGEHGRSREGAVALTCSRRVGRGCGCLPQASCCPSACLSERNTNCPLGQRVRQLKEQQHGGHASAQATLCSPNMCPQNSLPPLVLLYVWGLPPRPAALAVQPAHWNSRRRGFREERPATSGLRMWL